MSNLTNLLARDRLKLSPAAFAGLLWAPALVGILVPIGLLWLAFRQDLAGRYGPQPVHTARDRVLLYSASGVMILLLPALVSGVPVQLPAIAAASVLLGHFFWRRRSALRWSMIPWRPLILPSGPKRARRRYRLRQAREVKGPTARNAAPRIRTLSGVRGIMVG